MKWWVGERTYSTTIRSSGDDVVLEFEVWVEDGGVELGFAVEAVADFGPVGYCFGHVRILGRGSC